MACERRRPAAGSRPRGGGAGGLRRLPDRRHSFTVGENDDVIEGLGLLDVTTTRGPVRAVGEILSRWTGRDGDDQWLTGFENHGGYTRLAPGAAAGHGGDRRRQLR